MSVFANYFNADGQLGRKTKLTHPYNYDPFTVWSREGEINGSVYTDRLWQWDWDKYHDLREKHFGDRSQLWWGQSEPSKVEAFLRDYMEEPALELIAIIEYCNVSNGYPVWRFDYYLDAGDGLYRKQGE